MTPAERILAVCSEMRALASLPTLADPFTLGQWAQALEDVAACLSHDCTKTAPPKNDKARDGGLSG